MLCFVLTRWILRRERNLIHLENFEHTILLWDKLLSNCLLITFYATENVQKIFHDNNELCVSRVKTCYHWVILLVFSCLALNGKVYSHITLDGESALIKWFWGHPFHRKFIGILWAVHVFIDLSHQPKVRHFHPTVIANKDVTSCKVSMNKITFTEMILIKKGIERFEILGLYIQTEN